MDQGPGGRADVAEMAGDSGARSAGDILFEKEFDKWQQKVDFHLTLDEGGKDIVVEGIASDTGLITKLFDKTEVIKDAIALVCGPPIMCKFVVEKLKEQGLADTDIYLSLERRMECGVGVCEHCAVGPYFVCKDGPVFTWEQLKGVEGVI